MSEWKLKRFWKEAGVERAEEGFLVLLDGRSIKTPAKAALVVPSEALAQAVAAEWAAVKEEIDPRVMPYTRSANAAIDKVAVQFDEVAALIAAYADSDLLCYRADSPAELRARQDAAWDKLLDWAKSEHALHMKVSEGVMYSAQAPAVVSNALALTKNLSPFGLTAFHDLVSLSGSFVIGLAATEKYESPENLWKTSRIDEIWQEELWGEDEEASEMAAKKADAFAHAASFYNLTTQL